MKNIVVVFGGEDREEQAARKVCAEWKVPTATATVDGVKVHAGNAYKANGHQIDRYTAPSGPLNQVFSTEKPSEYEVVIFECSKDAAAGRGIVAVCDHHNPGDPGYGLGPERFWEASSIGQLCTLIGYEPTSEELYAAAGDHCPAAAYKGLCEGIDPEKFKAYRINGLVKVIKSESSPTDAWPFQADDREQVEKDIAFATALVRIAPQSKFKGVKDLRQYGQVAQLPEAALISGLAYLAQIPEVDRTGMPTGHVKIVLGGDNEPFTVSSVIQWLNAMPNGVGDACGVPARGFAGRVFAAGNHPGDPTV